MRKWVCILSLSFTVSAMATDVMLMNRIGPSKSELYVANADGTSEHKLLSTSGFDYHASYSYDGKWIGFTSESQNPIQIVTVPSLDPLQSELASEGAL
jgi:Tol biopolymer transport system component